MNISSYIKNSKSNPVLQKRGFQPVSLISNLSKIIETLVHKRVSNFLTEQNALYEKQFGFRNNRFTMHALTERTEKIRQACDSAQFACEIFLDLQKAIDTVKHKKSKILYRNR